jgi:hypothetical protein
MDFSRVSALLPSPWSREVRGVTRESAGVVVEARNHGVCLLLSFPVELFVLVFGQLCPVDLMHCRLVNKVFLAAASHDDVWRSHSESLDMRKGPLQSGQPPSGPIWSFMLQYWTRKSQQSEGKSLQDMVDEWTG